MPENCNYCALGIYEYPCNFTNQEHLCEDGRPPDCPLVEVPPHGRLIDADAIPYIFGSTHATEYDTVTKFVINKLPTIIEAEGE